MTKDGSCGIHLEPGGPTSTRVNLRRDTGALDTAILVKNTTKTQINIKTKTRAQPNIIIKGITQKNMDKGRF